MAKSMPPNAPELRPQMIELVRTGCTPERLAETLEPSARTIPNAFAQAERPQRAGSRARGRVS